MEMAGRGRAGKPKSGKVEGSNKKELEMGSREVREGSLSVPNSSHFRVCLEWGRGKHLSFLLFWTLRPRKLSSPPGVLSEALSRNSK